MKKIIKEKLYEQEFEEEYEEEEQELCSQCGNDYVYQDDLCLDCFNEREDENANIRKFLKK
jgi:uncharacterized OB-fold protein